MPDRTDRGYVAKAALLALAYAVAAKLGLAMDAVEGFATLLWAPSGMALAALVLGGRRLWPGVAAGALVVNVLAGAPVPVAAGIAAGNTLEALLATLALERLGFRAARRRSGRATTSSPSPRTSCAPPSPRSCSSSMP